VSGLAIPVPRGDLSWLQPLWEAWSSVTVLLACTRVRGVWLLYVVWAFDGGL